MNSLDPALHRRPIAPPQAVVIGSQLSSATMRRLTFSVGPGFEVDPGMLGPWLKLIIPLCDGPVAWPHYDAGTRRIIWPPEGRRPAIRTYSVRDWRPERRELDVDIALHGEGAGARFAQGARIGDRVGVWGPGAIDQPEGVRWYLLAGDHTAVPAIAYMLARLPAGAGADVVLILPEKPDGPSPFSPRADVRILVEPDARLRPRRLVEAVRAAPWPATEDVLLWAGAEAASARALRRFAKGERRLPPTRFQILNYWKAGVAEGAFDYCE
jgi:NADPH-dependent ferric siderophore reductase